MGDLTCRQIAGHNQCSFNSKLIQDSEVSSSIDVVGHYQDLVIPVTNFHNEDKGFMVLAGDVFDVPIRKDIVHRVVRWQLAKRQQVLFGYLCFDT